jgi:late competence protein required for DNA uptake (superfamily II DNA/RNA helicase)
MEAQIERAKELAAQNIIRRVSADTRRSESVEALREKTLKLFQGSK